MTDTPPLPPAGHQLHPHQRERLDLFQRRVALLNQFSLLQQRQVTFTVRLMRHPTDRRNAFEGGYRLDDYVAFASSFRPFLLEGESIHFHSVTRFLRNNLRSEGRHVLAAWVHHSRRAWGRILNSTPYQVTFPGQDPITTREALEHFVYTDMVHADIERTRFLESLSQEVRAILQTMAQRSLPDLYQCTHNVDAVITHWIGDPQHELPAPRDEDLAAVLPQ